LATVFVDTSGLYLLLNASDPSNAQARRLWEELLESEDLLTHNYVVLETAALVQRRLGMAAVGDVFGVLAPALEIRWVDQRLHDAGVATLLAENRRRLSLVDAVSFIVMREAGISRAFAFDDDFRAAGFETLAD